MMKSPLEHSQPWSCSRLIQTGEIPHRWSPSLPARSWDNNHWTSVMESPVCIKQPQGHGCACSRGLSHEMFSDTICEVRRLYHSTSAMESPVCIKQTVVVYALKLTPLVFTICRIVVVRLVVWAIACLIQLISHIWPLSLQLVCNHGNYSNLQYGNNNHLKV